jgi:hypothetical protein
MDIKINIKTARKYRNEEIKLYWNTLPEEKRNPKIVAALWGVSQRTFYRIINGK